MHRPGGNGDSGAKTLWEGIRGDAMVAGGRKRRDSLRGWAFAGRPSAAVRGLDRDRGAVVLFVDSKRGIVTGLIRETSSVGGWIVLSSMEVPRVVEQQERMSTWREGEVVGSTGS